MSQNKNGITDSFFESNPTSRPLVRPQAKSPFDHPCKDNGRTGFKQKAKTVSQEVTYIDHQIRRRKSLAFWFLSIFAIEFAAVALQVVWR